ncbi:type II secretion system protein [Candidatus Dependentiae bacterium]|nr:type II secretion system protein [Candidatus Dependentiae bacterium]
MKKKKNEKGFTIIEMLIVLAVSSIMLATLGVAIVSFQRNFGEKTEKHHTAMYLEQIIKMIQLEFPGANTVPIVGTCPTCTLSFAPFPSDEDNSFQEAKFGTVKLIFVAQYDDLFDNNWNYDTTKFLFISQIESGTFTQQSDIGIKVFDLNIYKTTNNLTMAVTRMNLLSVDRPESAYLEEVSITNEDGNWYLIGFFFRLRNYWYKDKSIEIASGKKNPYNFDFTLNTNLKIRN